jgi:alcohol dehydrogenase (cytochrome c)
MNESTLWANRPLRAGRAVGAVTTLLLATFAAQAQNLFPNDSTARFTAEQAARGQAAYSRACVSCHGAALEGSQFAVPLKGSVFESHWRGRTRTALSEQIRATMPPRGLGSVSGQAYSDIEAYILQVNGVAPVVGSTTAAAAPAAPSEPRIEGRAPGDSSTPVVVRGDSGPLYQSALAARAAKLAALTPVTDAMLLKPSPADWLIWRRTYSGHGYSPLAVINRSNVAQLRAGWSWSLPDSMNEITPLVHDGVMFIYSGPVVQALDATTGDLLWQYLRSLPDEFDNGRGGRVKTLAIFGDRLFVPTTDGHMLALDVRTGRVIWDQQVITDAERAMNGKAEGVALHLDGGPIVAKGMVIMGVSLGLENAKGGCFIVGLDAQTGKEAWRFHTIARPGQPGGDSWNGAPVAERFGGGVWTAGSYDAELDLVYFGTGNTYNAATLLEPRPGTQRVSNNDGLYTDSTVALRPDTGALVWHYQHHKRDVWDLDWVFEQSVVTLPINGKPRKLVVTGGKIAIFDAVDAATGAFVFSKDMGLQNIFLAIDPKTGEKTINPAVQPEAGIAKLLCPSAVGARNWPATAFNPETQILYVPMTESCTDYTYAPRSAAATAAGGTDMRFAPHLPPGSDGLFGRLTAVNLQTQQIVWTHRQRIPTAGSTLATAGGLLFNGDLDRYFYAYDQATGTVLWRTRLNAAPESSPITYAVNGRQYVAVVAGGGSAVGASGRSMVPELGSAAAGVTLTVFELP